MKIPFRLTSSVLLVASAAMDLSISHWSITQGVYDDSILEDAVLCRFYPLCSEFLGLMCLVVAVATKCKWARWHLAACLAWLMPSYHEIHQTATFVHLTSQFSITNLWYMEVDYFLDRLAPSHIALLYSSRGNLILSWFIAIGGLCKILNINLKAETVFACCHDYSWYLVLFPAIALWRHLLGSSSNRELQRELTQSVLKEDLSLLAATWQ